MGHLYHGYVKQPEGTSLWSAHCCCDFLLQTAGDLPYHPFFPWLGVMIDIPFLDVYPNNQFMNPGECVFVCSPPIFLQVYGYLQKSAPRLPNPQGGCKDYDLGTTSIGELRTSQVWIWAVSWNGGTPKSIYPLVNIQENMENHYV